MSFYYYKVNYWADSLLTERTGLVASEDLYTATNEIISHYGEESIKNINVSYFHENTIEFLEEKSIEEVNEIFDK